MRCMRLIAILLSVAFLFASTEFCEEAAGEACHENDHCNCATFCSASCSKLMIRDNTLTALPYFVVSFFYPSEQIFSHTLVVRTIKHPPKTLV